MNCFVLLFAVFLWAACGRSSIITLAAPHTQHTGVAPAHHPHQVIHHRNAPDVSGTTDYSVMAKRSFDNGMQLRILPLGASIVYGLKSSDGNGFRYALRNQLIFDGNPVNMVGSVESGTMTDNQVEGWPGYVITQVSETSDLSLPTKPNLVLLNIGHNDCVQNLDILNAGERLGDLIDHIFDTVPGVTVIASTLLPTSDAATQANTETYNSQIPGIVQSRQADGKKVTYVDFGSSYFSLSDIGSDGTHPTDAGYLKMAEVWHQGITVADRQGWLSPPASASGVSDAVPTGAGSTCNKIPGAAIGPTQTQLGSGSDDGPYQHTGVQIAGFAGFQNPSTVKFNNPFPEGVFWADIDGDGVDDYVYVGSNSNYGLGVALSLGGGNFGDYLYYNFTPSCNRPGVHFADMTGDGRADFCCLGRDGGLVCWQNTAGADARSPEWIDMGTVKESEGYPQAQVRLADIDGDGRTDYVAFDSSTTKIYGWRNGALQNGPPEYWYPMSGVFSGLPQHDLGGWRFVDLNGDKKDDLVWIDANGQCTTWINRRGYSVGLSPEWVSHGITHGGSAGPVNVTFGKFMGSGRADYALTTIRDGNVFIDRWENKDQGGTMVRGDGARYCDMTGSGSDDYVFIDATGGITLFENKHSWGTWVPWGEIHNVNRARQEVHLADFDGDGKCDVLLVDKGSGSTTVHLNKFAFGKFDFSDIGVVTGGASCTESYGSDKHDLGVRWHDLDGDGRADFLCMQSNGVVNGFLNKGVNDMVDQGLIKHTEGRERKNLRFADLNGDGRDDLLYVNMMNGTVEVFYNVGKIPTAGSAFQWKWDGVVSPGGSSRGQCVEFGALYGLGRADYIAVEPASNQAWTWFNVCPDGVGPVNPSLPFDAPPAPTVDSPTSTPDDDDDHDDFDEDDDFPICDYDIEFTNLDDLDAAAGDLTSRCLTIQTLQTLINMLDIAYNNYSAVNDGYDEQFGYYVTYIEKIVPKVLDSTFMFDGANANTLEVMAPIGPGMSFFDCQTDKKGSASFPCSEVHHHFLEMATHKTTLTLTDSDGYTGALADSGLSADWVVFGDHEVDKLSEQFRSIRDYQYHFIGYPIENPSIEVPNPKDIVTKGLGNVPDLMIDMASTLGDIILGAYTGGSVSDAVMAYSTPVFLLIQAVDGMAQAKLLAAQEIKDEKEEEKRKRNFILLIVSIVLMFVPIVGEEIALAAGFASLARAIAIGGELGNSALAVYDTVQDPASAVVNVLGMLFGVGAIARVSRDGEGIGSVAKIRRGMSADEVAGLGAIFKNSDDKLQNIVKACRL